MSTHYATGRVPIVEVIVTEELDMATAARVRMRLEEALQLHPVHLVVDLAGCPYLDAAGICMLLQVHRQARQRGAQLILRAPTPRLRRNLALARVDHVLQVTPPDADAGRP